MKAIINDLSSYLTLKLGEMVFIDMIPIAKGNALMVRADPSPMVETRYMDSSRAGNFAFSLYAQGDGELAYNKLVDATKFLDLGSIGNNLEVKIEPQVQPSIVAKHDNGDFLYTASFKLEYYKEQ